MSLASYLLNLNSHRPFPLPQRSWKYYQEWHDSVFLHFKVPQEILCELLPQGLILDTYQDEAWVSVVAFSVKNMRLKFLPPLPYLSDFHEINLRTYVVKDGVPGIYFITIETGKAATVFLARKFIGLKYKQANIKKKYGRYLLTNSNEGNNLNLKYCTLQNISEKSGLDKWLTERYCAYEKIGKELYRFNIHHREWPLKKVKLRKMDVEYPIAQLKTSRPDLQHYSPQQKVLLWGREKC